MSTPAAQLRQKLKQGAAFGTFVKLGRREVIEILSRAGLDFVICDLEHSQISESEAGTMILAGLNSGLPVVVRVPHFDPGPINRLLEAGAAGIQLPQVQTRAQSLAFQQACRYPPQGSRSISLAQSAAGFGAEPLLDYIHRANDEVLVIGQLESKELEQPVEALVRGLSVAFIGTLDLTVDMGVPGKLDDPAIQERLRAIEHAASAEGVHLGIYADSPARAAQAAAAGYRFIAVSSDVAALSSGAKNWIKQLQEVAAGATGRP
ncbi:MAG TPA: aldolase/citrate lyase family protein [Terriglobales bacterium]|nr:aldolase/citrate lyase family protein [Terriglobales bacterium]